MAHMDAMRLLVILCSIMSRVTGQGDLCNYDSNTADISNTTQSVIVSTSSSSNGCQCTITSTNQQRVQLTITKRLIVESYNASEGCGVIFHGHYNNHWYYTCPQPQDEDRDLSLNVILEGTDAYTLDLYNMENKDVIASLEVELISSSIDSLQMTCGSTSPTSLPYRHCPCATYVVPQIVPIAADEPVNRRLMVGFLAALGFLLLIGAAVLIWWIVSKKRPRMRKEKEFENNTPFPESASSIDNPGYSRDDNSQPTGIKYADIDHSKMKTPRPFDYERDATMHGLGTIYAEIDLSKNTTPVQRSLPFDPDPSLNLGMATGSKSQLFKGSTDSGLYSTIQSNVQTPSLAGIGAYGIISSSQSSQMDNLDHVQPGSKLPPPAAHSSPPRSPAPPKTKEEIEALYAKPIKTKKTPQKSPSSNSQTTSPNPVNYNPSPMSQGSNIYHDIRSPMSQTSNVYNEIRDSQLYDNSNIYDNNIYSTIGERRSSNTSISLNGSRHNASLNGSRHTVETEI